MLLFSFVNCLVLSLSFLSSMKPYSAFFIVLYTTLSLTYALSFIVFVLFIDLCSPLSFVQYCPHYHLCYHRNLTAFPILINTTSSLTPNLCTRIVFSIVLVLFVFVLLCYVFNIVVTIISGIIKTLLPSLFFFTPSYL